LSLQSSKFGDGVTPALCSAAAIGSARVMDHWNGRSTGGAPAAVIDRANSRLNVPLPIRYHGTFGRPGCALNRPT
jgi:hypothetical protein